MMVDLEYQMKPIKMVGMKSFLIKVMKEEVDIGATGTHKYRIKHGPNKGKVL